MVNTFNSHQYSNRNCKWCYGTKPNCLMCVAERKKQSAKLEKYRTEIANFKAERAKKMAVWAAKEFIEGAIDPTAISIISHLSNLSIEQVSIELREQALRNLDKAEKEFSTPKPLITVSKQNLD